MSFERKKKRALAIMESKHMWRSSYAPLLLRGLWKSGLNIPPLPFASFWQNTIILGFGFTLTWGLIMWFCVWQDMGVQPVWAILRSVFGGMLFGVMMAAFHRWRKRANNLPEWKDL